MSMIPFKALTQIAGVAGALYSGHQLKKISMKIKEDYDFSNITKGRDLAESQGVRKRNDTKKLSNIRIFFNNLPQKTKRLSSQLYKNALPLVDNLVSLSSCAVGAMTGNPMLAFGGICKLATNFISHEYFLNRTEKKYESKRSAFSKAIGTKPIALEPCPHTDAQHEAIKKAGGKPTHISVVAPGVETRNAKEAELKEIWKLKEDMTHPKEAFIKLTATYPEGKEKVTYPIDERYYEKCDEDQEIDGELNDGNKRQEKFKVGSTGIPEGTIFKDYIVKIESPGFRGQEDTALTDLRDEKPAWSLSSTMASVALAGLVGAVAIGTPLGCVMQGKSLLNSLATAVGVGTSISEFFSPCSVNAAEMSGYSAHMLSTDQDINLNKSDALSKLAHMKIPTAAEKAAGKGKKYHMLIDFNGTLTNGSKLVNTPLEGQDGDVQEKAGWWQIPINFIGGMLTPFQKPLEAAFKGLGKELSGVKGVLDKVDMKSIIEIGEHVNKEHHIHVALAEGHTPKAGEAKHKIGDQDTVSDAINEKYKDNEEQKKALLAQLDKMAKQAEPKDAVKQKYILSDDGVTTLHEISGGWYTKGENTQDQYAIGNDRLIEEAIKESYPEEQHSKLLEKFQAAEAQFQKDKESDLSQATFMMVKGEIHIVETQPKIREDAKAFLDAHRGQDQGQDNFTVITGGVLPESVKKELGLNDKNSKQQCKPQEKLEKAKKIAKERGLEAEQMIAFGDGRNDQPMFKYANVAVQMVDSVSAGDTTPNAANVFSDVVLRDLSQFDTLHEAAEKVTKTGNLLSGTALLYGLSADKLLHAVAHKFAHNPVSHMVQHIVSDQFFRKTAEIFSRRAVPKKSPESLLGSPEGASSFQPDRTAAA